MRPPRAAVLLDERQVRWLGAALLAAGLVLPWVILGWRALHAPIPEAPKTVPELRPEMVVLPAGRFMMGSPPDEEGRYDDERLHEVTLSRPFAVSRTEVTQEQFKAVMGETALHTGKDFGGFACAQAGLGDKLPVVCVSWLEAVEYCNRLSEREGLEPVYGIRGDAVTPKEGAGGYRLPTEAEWEYAARAGTQEPWVGTADPAITCRYGNVADQSLREAYPKASLFPCNDGSAQLAPVRDRLPNRWQLYGFGGNAAEWVWDWYGEYLPGEAGAVDPVGPAGGSDRVIRGGFWRSVPRYARVAIRSRVPARQPARRRGLSHCEVLFTLCPFTL